jgi:hypothetical protein
LEKSLGNAIVMTVVLATHTANQIARLKKAAPIGAAVLAALVGVDHHLPFRITPPNQHH